MVETVKTRAALLAEMADGGNNTAEEIRNGIVSMYPVVIAKPADQSLASSTTLQDDDDLVIAIGANEVWVVRYVLFPACADASVDIKTNITAPSGASGFRGQIAPTDGATNTSNYTKAQSFDLDGTTGLSAGVIDSDVAEQPIYVDAYINNGANAGNVTLQWAQVNSSATAMILREGSYLVAYQQNNP